MPRYIDADELRKRLEDSKGYDSEDEFTIAWNAGINHGIVEIMDMSTAEVVKVVRCKDCRYVFKEDEYSYWCNGFTSPMRLVTPETFCSHGRRRND